jgi:hypothetical protein
MQKRTILHQKFSNFEIIITIFILVTVLVFEITPNASFSPLMMKMKTSNKIQKNHNMLPIIIYKRPEDDHIILGITTGSIVFFSRHPFSSSSDDKKRNKLVHSSFRIKESVLSALEREAQKRGLSLSSLVNKTLENYVTCDMFFDELGFILVGKEFLRKTFSGLNEKHVEELGRDLGSTVAKEYVSYFFPEVNSDTLVKFLDLWFMRFQSYQHRVDDQNNRNYFIVNHDINMNFSIALKAMLEGLIEPVFKRSIDFKDLTSRTITFSFIVS